MKKYTLDFKYIRNEYAAPLAIINCVLDAVIDGVEVSTEQIRIRKNFDSLVRCLTNAMRMDLEPQDCIKMSDKLELLSDCGCYRKLAESVKSVEKLITEPIEVELVGDACKNVMNWVPEFDANKVKITIGSVSSGSSKKEEYTDFENALANILYGREYTGPTETEEAIESSFKAYQEVARKLAPSLLREARKEIMMENLDQALAQETSESWNKRLDNNGLVDD